LEDVPRLLAIQQLSELLSALSHPARIRIVEELRAGEHDVNYLAEALELPHARVSQHLSVLRAQHIVRRRREGRRAHYELRNRHLARWLLDGLDFLEARIRESEAIRTSVEEARDRFSD
jgi:DNA-binding transcriptional ArsR family regulator